MSTRRAVYGKLSGDTTLNNLLGAAAAGYTKSIYDDVAPEGANYPMVVFSQQTGTPTEAFNKPSAFETDIWLVKGVDRSTSSDTVEGIQSRIQVLLNDATLSISGATLSYLRRQTDVRYVEVTDGVQYRHAGALYRLIWQ